MLLIVSKQPDTSSQPPFYGPDHLSRPPVQEGIEILTHLPSHMELPEENTSRRRF